MMLTYLAHVFDRLSLHGRNMTVSDVPVKRDGLGARKKAVPFESVEVFRKDLSLALYFSPSSSMIFRLLCLLPSAALYADDLAICSPPPPPVPTAVEATQGAVIRLER